MVDQLSWGLSSPAPATTGSGGWSARPPHLARMPRSSPPRQRPGLMAYCVSGVSDVSALRRGAALHPGVSAAQRAPAICQVLRTVHVFIGFCLSKRRYGVSQGVAN